MRSGTDITSELDLPPDLRTACPRILVVDDEMTVYGGRGSPSEFRGHPVLEKPFGPLELSRALLSLTGRA